MNNLKRFSVGTIVLWTAVGSCLAQTISGASPAPLSASDQQIQAKDLADKSGKLQVDDFTGSFGYSIPIACAPARNGSQPALALAYSSKGENGWCGMGWRLDIGYIERNTQNGFPIQFTTATPPAPSTAYDDTKGFILNLFGKELKLFSVATNGSLVEYRAEVDTEFLRCFLDTSSNNRWLVYDKSGNVYYFGQTSGTTGSRVVNSKWGSGYSATFHWGLDQIDTATGDRTTIAYTTYNDLDNPSIPEKTIYPTQITYNSHANINGYGASFTGQHTISFTTEIRPDSRLSYRWGFRTKQSRRLTSIACQVGSQKVWRYAMSYNVSPATKRSLLRTVTVYGSDDTTALPVQTFAYQANPNAVSFGPPVQWNNLNLNTPGGPANSYEPHVTDVDAADNGNVQADLVDIDGDGLPDRVCYDSSTTPNRYQVQKNLGMQANGNGSFGNRYAFGPTSTGGGMTASDSNPIPDKTSWAALNSGPMNSGHTYILDINGDGLPGRVCDYWKPWDSLDGYNPVNTAYDHFEIMTNTGGGFLPTTATAWSVDRGPYTAPSITLQDLSLYACVESGGVNTGLFDINGDGLPDRVMSMYYTEGAMIYFRVQFNTGSGFTPVKLFGPYHSQNWNNYGAGQINYPSYQWAGIETPDAHVIDINGDGLPDRVMLPMDPNHPGWESYINPILPAVTTNYCVEFNNGYSFESTNTSTTAPGAFDKWPGVKSQYNNDAGISINYAAMINLPFVGLFDVNGDGLPDRVMLDESTAHNNNTSKGWLVYLNNGRGFDTTPTNVSGIYDQSCLGNPNDTPNDRGWWGIESSWLGNMVVTLMDINGDGLLDRVMAVDNNVTGGSFYTYFLVQTNMGPFPDLLTNINNGIGGAIAVSYKPSTAYDNRKDPTVANSASTLPFVQYTVATVTEYDGINPPRTNSYSYGGGFYDGVRREFRGFAVVTNTDPTLRSTVTYFHTGGGRNYSALGEYQDGGNFAKSGRAYRTESYGTDGLLYKMVINQVDQTNIGSSTYPRYFPFVSQTFDYDYPGGGSPRIAGSKFVYSHTATDAKIFNLTQKVLWGEVANVDLTSIAAPTDVVTSDTKTNVTTYSTLSGNGYILDLPDTADLVDSGNNVIQETKYTYDQTSGVALSKRTRISAGYYATNSYGNYNTYGLVGQTTDPVGVQTTITYDSTYNTYPATVTAGSFTTTTSYDARSGLLAVFTDPAGLTVSNSFDAFCRPVESDKIPVGGGSIIWMKKYSYPATLKPIVSGLATNYTDVMNNDGIGGVESRTYIDGFGKSVQARVQGENGNYRVVSTAYDERDNVFLTMWPIFGNSASFSKPTTGQTATWIGYDAAGRLATNRPVSVTFNANGAFSSKTDLTGDGTSSPLAAKTWSYANGSDPWWIVSTDEDGKVRRYDLDAFGRTNQIQEVDGANTYITTLNYDLANNLTNIVNANNENIYFAYNDAGSLVAMADPYLGQWTYVRDYAGRLRVQTDARGDVVSNSYVNSSSQQDPLGRLQVQTVFSTNYSNHILIPAYTNIYAYDSSDDGNFTVYPGLLYKVTDGEGWEKTGYDSRARVIKAARHLNINNQTYTNSYTLDDGNNVTSIAYPNSGPVITNLYFTSGSLKQVSRGAYNYYTVNAANIDEFGHVTNFAYGNGLATSRGYYSTSKRLQTISVGSVFSRTYQYTAGEDISFINGAGVTNVSVTYDNLHRIKTFTGLTGSYGYDSVGNTSGPHSLDHRTQNLR